MGNDRDAIALRQATLSDAAMIGAVRVASWHETYAGIFPDTLLAALSVEARTAMWRDILGTSGKVADRAVVVAEHGGVIIGFGACGAQRDRSCADAGFGGEIGALYVLRAYRQRGAGRAIMAALAQALSDLGHSTASLWVLHQNYPARAFYERLGGDIIGEKSDSASGVTLVEIGYGWRDLSRLTT